MEAAGFKNIIRVVMGSASICMHLYGVLYQDLHGKCMSVESTESFSYLYLFYKYSLYYGTHYVFQGKTSTLGQNFESGTRGFDGKGEGF